MIDLKLYKVTIIAHNYKSIILSYYNSVQYHVVFHLQYILMLQCCSVHKRVRQSKVLITDSSIAIPFLRHALYDSSNRNLKIHNLIRVYEKDKDLSLYPGGDSNLRLMLIFIFRTNILMTEERVQDVQMTLLS